MYLEGFSDVEHIFSEYQLTDAQKEFVKQIVYGVYTQEDYEGSSQVVFIGSDNKLYEVNASHCSCYGLEEQWEPEETSLEYFLERQERNAYVDTNLMLELAQATYVTSRNLI